ncbi:unnamed protein product [Coffea canephora]|uniref:Uncharacterized protein n=1 Tax=Coffea canephora TaxID=49390 RepID=A0A068V473_COFCA|nr:unnamed protein product [Coffea canephora]
MASDIIATVLLDLELLVKDFGVEYFRVLDLKAELRLLRTLFWCAREWNYDLYSKPGNNNNLASFLTSLEPAVEEKILDLYNDCLSEERFRELGLNSHLIGLKQEQFFPLEQGTYSYGRSYMGEERFSYDQGFMGMGSNASFNLLKGKDKYSYGLGGEEVWTFDWESKFDHKVGEIRTTCIYNSKQEISRSYINLLDYYNSLQNHSSWGPKIMEFIDFLLVNIEDVQTWVRVDDQDVRDLLEALKEKVAFSKNFIRFAEWRGFEYGRLEVLFMRLQVVAIDAAARVFHMWAFYPYDYKEARDNKMRLIFSELLQKMEAVDPQIRETYIQVLLSGSPHARTLEIEEHILGDFVDSLLYRIWEGLTHSITCVVSLEDQMPILYEGLRFLRTILKKYFEKLPNKVKDLIRAAVSEAGIVICSLFVQGLKEGLAKEMDSALVNLLGKIKLIKVVTSALIFPKTDELGFMNFFLQNLKDLPSCKVDSNVFASNEIQTVLDDLISLRSLLENNLEERNQDEKLQALSRHAVEVAYKAQLMIQSLVVGNDPDYSPMIFGPLTEEINFIKMEALKLGDNRCSMASQKPIRSSDSLPSQGRTPAINKAVVSLNDEAKKIIDQLVRGSKQLGIISVVGMPGLGKTTLARSVFNDPSVTRTFHSHAWCIVSQVYTKKDLVLQILGWIVPELSDQYLNKSEVDLEEELKKRLMKNKYLIVLDDVWDADAWSGLERSLPNDANGSRILLTSRHPEVAKKINPNCEPHPLRQLTDDESWELLQKRLSCRDSYDEKLGREIAKNCKGLPLTVVIVAGILSNSGQDGWEEIAGRLSLNTLSITEQCMDIIKLSYRNLPDFLKPSFLYFGAFPVGQEIPFGKLMRLWIAEGFVQKSDGKSLEDVAGDYVNDLIGRSLVMISKERSLGGIKSCRVHDLLHEFCVVTAKKEKFLSLVSGYDELLTFNGQCNQQRLCVYSLQEHFERSRIFCPSVRSILFFPLDNAYGPKHCRLLFNLCIFKLLNVLNLEQIHLGFCFPSETLLLVELRYLAAQGEFDSIPSSISNLSSLETLLVKSHSTAVLPDTIWNMQKLRHLHGGFSLLGSSLATENLEMSSVLHNLETFSVLRLSFGQSIEKILRKLPNIRRLKCTLFESGKSTGDCNRTVAVQFLSRLQSLHLSSSFGRVKYHSELHFPSNLRKLSLSYLHSSIIPELRDLPNLEVLKLLSIHCEENTWDMEEEWELPKLRFLKLGSLDIVRWTSTSDHFPCLEKLVLQQCRKLEEIPSCLEVIEPLEMIEVRHCPVLDRSLLLKIEEEQNSSGNYDFKIFIFQ